VIPCGPMRVKTARQFRRAIQHTIGFAATALLVSLAGCTHSSAPPPRIETARDVPPPEISESSRAPVGPELRSTARDAFTVRVQYLQTTQAQEVIATGELLVSSREMGLKRLPAGTWRVSARASAPARFVYPVFVKSFAHHETAALRAAQEDWRKRGFEPAVTTLGRAVAGGDGVLHDNRIYWLSVQRCRSQAEADALKKRLQAEKVWAWTRQQVAEPAQGTAIFRSGSGETVLETSIPVTLRSEGTIALPDARKGQPPVEVPGPMEILIDQTGNTAFLGDLPLEEYLRGILPAEMYASWPLEALKAQAVAARSEIIVHAAGKHLFEGYDFCIEQHCRAYGGRALCDSRTDQAVAETSGVILVNTDGSVVPTVFSSNCGGWTESNENVWDGASESALRGRPDAEAQAGHRDHFGSNNVDRWLNSAGRAYCSGDSDYYRWSRSISLAKLSAQFNRDYGIGNLRAIEALERGVSGRLKSVRLVGDRKSAVINKELNIRRAFENLPSALCTFSIQKGAVQVKGAGRGHGVGLCQHGAHGMALENLTYDVILRHYFTGTSLARL
jgi:stage II sporulation protein D